MTIFLLSFVATFAQVVKIGMMGSAVGTINTVDDVKLFPLDGENYFAPSYDLQRGTFYFRQDNTILWGATAFPSGTAVKNSDNRISIMEAGAYTINFNRISGAYSIIKDGTTVPPVIVDPIVPEPVIPNPGRNIYVKREGSTTAPKIHVWTNDSGKDVAITNTSSWPNNLPTMTADTDGWFKYNVTANSVGTLFRYGTFQTPDYKYYNQDVWILLNSDGTQKTVSLTDLRVETPKVSFSSSQTPQADGCYLENQEVYIYLSSNIPNTLVYYTLDGTDPIPGVGSTAIGYSTLSINASASRVKAVIYNGTQRISDIVTKDYCFKKGIVTINVSPAPNANGKYFIGQKVTVTLTSNATEFPIWYTTDGTAPYYISGSKQDYTVPFEITTDAEIGANMYLGGGWRYGRYTETALKSIQFEAAPEVPTFTYSTTPWLNENGKYNAGANVAVTFNLSPSNPDWDVYYSLDNQEVDLTKINTGANTLNPIRYSGVFNVNSDKVVYAKLYNVKTGQSQGVSPMIFSFEPSQTQRTIYVKREGSTTAPRIHVWTNDSGKDVAITNTSSWPNNLPIMTSDTNGWFKYAVTANNVGTLFRYGTFQTPDYKYYNQDVWITLNADGSRKSVSFSKPYEETPVVLSMTKDVEPKANGKYNLGASVKVTFTSNGGGYKRYIAYTTDGSDPKTSSTYQLIVVNQYVPAELVINSNTNLRAIEEGIYRSGPYSNEVAFNFQFEPVSIVTITKDKQPNANGKYAFGETVNVSINRTEGCGGCSYADFYTVDGTDPKTSATKIAGSFVTLPINKTTTVRAISYPSMGSSANYTDVSETLTFETTVPVPTFTFSTNPGPKNNGKYTIGTPVQVTFNLSPVSADWDIYYSLDGNDVDLTKINTGVNTLNPIRYAAPFNVSSNVVVYAKLYNVKTGQSQGVSPMNFEFEAAQPEYTIYVKRQSAQYSSAPRIHVWTKETGVDVPVTNPSNWPNNLTYMSHMGMGWFTYTTTKPQFGFLFVFPDKKTPDYKYYSKNVWVLLDANGNTVSITDNMPTAAKEAIEAEEAEKVFTVSPNPVSSNFTVNYSTGKEESINLNIYSLAGQLLYTESFQTTVLQKEFSAQNLRLSSGTYIVQAQSASGVETKKIIVE